MVLGPGAEVSDLIKLGQARPPIQKTKKNPTFFIPYLHEIYTHFNEEKTKYYIKTTPQFCNLSNVFLVFFHVNFGGGHDHGQHAGW